jgi:PII-like signaling protein
MRIYYGEADRAKRKSFTDFVIERARTRGLAGCTVYRGITGFGANSIVRSANILALSSDLPMIIEIVDDRQHIDGLLNELDPDMPACLVTLEDVSVLRYKAAK